MKGFELGGVKFRQVESDRVPAKSEGDEFVIAKPDSALRFYESLRPHLPKAIMEIGMFEGGSLVYFDKLFKPTRLVGVDRRTTPIAALEDYRKARPHIETYYARFQDKAGVLQAARHNFPKGVDLVVDDASHLYVETKATFDMLFPLVREGGHYVIESWRGPKWRKRGEQDAESETPPAASRLVHELIGQVGEVPAVNSLAVHGECVCIRRGPGTYESKRSIAALPPGASAP